MIKSNWIKPKSDMGEICPLFKKLFSIKKPIEKAILRISARGVYAAKLNGKRVGNFILAPGWTEYLKRIQLQEYDITELLKEENTLTVCLAKGWYNGRITTSVETSSFPDALKDKRECAVIAEISVKYSDGSAEIFGTDDSWQVAESQLRFCDIYDGEIYDASFEPYFDDFAVIADNNDLSVLISQEGEEIVENERIEPIALIHTPKGETVIDFGQNLTGYPEFTVNAKAGDKVEFSFAEILDKDGNFYNENYRSAKCLFDYTCKDGLQTHKPELTFYGFRYLRIDKFPQKDFKLDQFAAIVVHSKLSRTGYIETSEPMLNQLFHNIIWGQKSNYLDVPTDCPQRDERLGWTGDAQVFVRAASYNFDVKRFFTKWLHDMALAQKENGIIPPIIPDVWDVECGAAWSDAVAICPWQMYLTYGDKDILVDMFPAICSWVDYITNTTTTKGLWTGKWQFGDWLELTAPFGGEKGETRDDLVASAYYAYSTNLLCKIGKILGKDVASYKKLYSLIVETFKKTYADNFKTQTEYVLALYFDLTDNKALVADALAKKIISDGNKMQTGFVGTPYLLHALSDNGYTDLAYDLLLRREYPSWLYPITKGATTMWEHWDGILPNGELWDKKMNSYNHYAYGAVADWMYGVCAGIKTVESAPGFEEIYFCPKPTDKIDSFSAKIDTAYGLVSSRWWHENNAVKYEIVTPSSAKAFINGKEYNLAPGKYLFD